MGEDFFFSLPNILSTLSSLGASCLKSGPSCCANEAPVLIVHVMNICKLIWMPVNDLALNDKYLH